MSGVSSRNNLRRIARPKILVVERLDDERGRAARDGGSVVGIERRHIVDDRQPVDGDVFGKRTGAGLRRLGSGIAAAISRNVDLALAPMILIGVDQVDRKIDGAADAGVIGQRRPGHPVDFVGEGQRGLAVHQQAPGQSVVFIGAHCSTAAV